MMLLALCIAIWLAYLSISLSLSFLLTMSIFRDHNYSVAIFQGLAEVLVTLGGCDNNCDEIRSVECINPMTNHSRCLAGSPQGMRRGFSAVILDEDIFVTGGISKMHSWVYILPKKFLDVLFWLF